MRPSSRLTVWPRPPRAVCDQPPAAHRGAARSTPPSRLSFTKPSLAARLCTMTSAVADLFDAMAADVRRSRALVRAPLRAPARDPARRRSVPRLAPAPARSTPAAAPAFSPRSSTDLGWTTHGVDLSAGLLAVARQRLPRAGLARGQRRGAALSATPASTPWSAAAARCRFVDDPARALAELGRVLRPGGRLLLDCEHRPSLDLAWTLASAADRRSRSATASRRARPGGALVSPATGCACPTPATACSGSSRRRELAGMLRAAGLMPVRAWGVHGVTNLLPSTLLHRAEPPRALAAVYRALLPRWTPRLSGTRAGARAGQQPGRAGRARSAERVDLDLGRPPLHLHRRQRESAAARRPAGRAWCR